MKKFTFIVTFEDSEDPAYPIDPPTVDTVAKEIQSNLKSVWPDAHIVVTWWLQLTPSERKLILQEYESGKLNMSNRKSNAGYLVSSVRALSRQTSNTALYGRDTVIQRLGSWLAGWSCCLSRPRGDGRHL